MFNRKIGRIIGLHEISRVKCYIHIMYIVSAQYIDYIVITR